VTEIILLTPDFRARGETEGRGDFPFSSMVSSARGEKDSLREEEAGEEERDAPLREEREREFISMLFFTRVWEGRESERESGVEEAFFPSASLPLCTNGRKLSI
jgi:hypothetical protein